MPHLPRSLRLGFGFRRGLVTLPFRHDSMTGRAALSPCFASLVDGPFVRMTFLVSCLAAFTRDTPLFVRIH